ncbi:MAG: VWA domain-containing protein [Thermoleophilia bacterium]
MSTGDAGVRKLVTFGRILREAGVEVGPGRIQDALRALDCVDMRNRDEVYSALACTLVARRDDLELFDRAFRAWFEKDPTRNEGRRPDMGIGIDERPQPPAPAKHPNESDDPDEVDEDQEEPDVLAAYSADENLRDRDFSTLTRSELLRLRRLMDRLVRVLPTRRSRRMEVAANGSQLAPRETLRRAMRREGEPIERAFRRPKKVERRVVFLCDVSGSMEPYSRALVLFLQAAVSAGRKVEAFTFGTRLTRLTPFLGGYDPEASLQRAARAVPDWAGGTRIGDNLKAFNDLYGRRGLTRGAVVVIVSDGWERGDVTTLANEMARLRRRCHSIIWVNPLKGSEGYEPLAAGMAAALPFVDTFLPGHNLNALESLAEALRKIDGRHSGVKPATLRAAA